MMTDDDDVLASPIHEAGLELLSALVEEEARVARAEAALAAARARLAALQARFGRLGRPPVEAIAAGEGRPPRRQRWGRPDDGRPSLRATILARMAASAGEVFTPARLAPLVGATSRDSVRNTLLALAAKGRIEKVGPGQYRVAATPM